MAPNSRRVWSFQNSVPTTQHLRKETQVTIKGEWGKDRKEENKIKMSKVHSLSAKRHIRSKRSIPTIAVKKWAE